MKSPFKKMLYRYEERENERYFCQLAHHNPIFIYTFIVPNFDI